MDRSLTSVPKRLYRQLTQVAPTVYKLWKDLQKSPLRAHIEVLSGPASMLKSDVTHWTIRVQNTGPRIWPSGGSCPVFVSYQWRAEGSQVRLDKTVQAGIHRLPTSLSADLPPGEEVVLAVVVESPDQVGPLVLEFGLSQKNVGWFHHKDPATVRVPCLVTEQPSQNSFYHYAFERSDLSKDYWSVVGPASEESFRKLGAVKLNWLKDLGLTPESRLLDVGCGTGLLTAALHDYLSDAGLYYGTDLIKKGVEFCQSIYHRPNFHFLQNEMTTIPIHDMQFDFVVFFSVFTHTYPEETVLLMKEAQRLLCDRGVIFADLFASSDVDKHGGHRGKMTVNWNYLQKQVEGCGLHAQVVKDLTQNISRSEQRLFVAFRKR